MQCTRTGWKYPGLLYYSSLPISSGKSVTWLFHQVASSRSLTSRIGRGGSDHLGSDDSHDTHRFWDVFTIFRSPATESFTDLVFDKYFCLLLFSNSGCLHARYHQRASLTTTSWKYGKNVPKAQSSSLFLREQEVSWHIDYNICESARVGKMYPGHSDNAPTLIDVFCLVWSLYHKDLYQFTANPGHGVEERTRIETVVPWSFMPYEFARSYSGKQYPWYSTMWSLKKLPSW